LPKENTFFLSTSSTHTIEGQARVKGCFSTEDPPSQNFLQRI
jgi:hypothetical protein